MTETPDPSPQQVLDLPLPANDSRASTVRGYLIALLTEIWRDGEGFSGKRPFGNSGWEYDLYGPMGAAGMVEITFDEDGYVEHLSNASRARADALILAAIGALGDAGGSAS